MKMKGESEKAGLKFNIEKTETMASSPIRSWQIDGETMETVRDFILGGSKITADGDCSHEIKRCLLLGRKAMTNLDSILKSRNVTLPTKVLLVKASIFPTVMCGCEIWTIKKAECQRIDAFELWCWRRLLSPLDCKEIKSVKLEGNQSWIYLGRTDAETETPIVWPPDTENWLTGKESDAGEDWRQEEKRMTENEMVGWHPWLWASSRSWWWTGKLTWLNDWTEYRTQKKQRYEVSGVRNHHGNQIPGEKKVFLLVWGVFTFGNIMCYFLQASHTHAHTQNMYLAKFSCSSVTTMMTKFSSDHNLFEYKWFLFPGFA